MNDDELKQWETKLRSLRPRRPSTGLKRRIFGAPARLLPKATWILGSLAPVAACVLVTFSIFNRENPGDQPLNGPMIAMLSSNQDHAEYELAGFRKGENSWSSVTFDWTNRSGFSSSIAPFLQDRMH